MSATQCNKIRKEHENSLESSKINSSSQIILDFKSSILNNLNIIKPLFIYTITNETTSVLNMLVNEAVDQINNGVEDYLNEINHNEKRTKELLNKINKYEDEKVLM